jgi:hypothetical protein
MEFAAIDAQGWYISHATVRSVHATVALAARAATAWNRSMGTGGPKVTVAARDSELGDRVHGTDARVCEQRARAQLEDLAAEQRRKIAESEREGMSAKSLAPMREHLALLEFWA